MVVSFLSACNSSTLSFSEIENVPNNVQHKVDSNLKLQLINDSEKGYYIVFHSSGEVETDVETQGDKVTIKFKVTNLQDDVVKQNTFYLTIDPEHDVIDVLVNGKAMPFDMVTVES
ncbi:hypothetical protein [Psychrobacillus sp. OK032]|uniref:hypothetical protein n=1 Tax=Psychrobacillus sp. OK032 TaxID=1884358 RepID=UPI0008C1AF80|nr:hypothetical protein [Psychrobacillus sp. OK032]SES07759.1 hypothetical protein SAMN05518872_10448 [Psychrobacillus sp. OK032]